MANTVHPGTSSKFAPAVLIGTNSNPSTSQCNKKWNDYAYNNGMENWIDRSKGQRMGLYVNRMNFNNLYVNPNVAPSNPRNPNDSNYSWDGINKVLASKAFTDDPDAYCIIRLFFAKSPPSFLVNDGTTTFRSQGKGFNGVNWYHPTVQQWWDDLSYALYQKFKNSKLWGIGFPEIKKPANDPTPYGDYSGLQGKYGQYGVQTYLDNSPGWCAYFFQSTDDKLAYGDLLQNQRIVMCHADPKPYAKGSGSKGGIGCPPPKQDAGGVDGHWGMMQNRDAVIRPCLAGLGEEHSLGMSGEPNGMKKNVTIPNNICSNPFGWSGGESFNPVPVDLWAWYHSKKGIIPCSILFCEDPVSSQTPSKYKQAFDALGHGSGNGSLIPPPVGFDPNPGEENQAPIFTSTPVTSVAVGSSYNYNVSATDPDGDALVMTAQTLPGWLTFTPSGGSATLSGIPSASDVGSHNVVLSVSDGELSVQQSFSIEVSDTNQAPVVDAGPDQAIQLPDTLQLNGSASDDGLPGGILTTSWQKVSGPGGVSFSDHFILNPVVTFTNAGSYVIELNATDGELNSVDSMNVVVSDETPGSCLDVGDAVECMNGVVIDKTDFGTYTVVIIERQ